MAINKAVQACNLIIFGAKGDLTRRKLLPSLYQLEKMGYIHPDTRIIGIGRAEWDAAAYIKEAKDALETFLNEEIEPSLWQKLSKLLDFFNLDVQDLNKFNSLAKYLEGDSKPAIYYFAMPPTTFGAVCHGLGHAGLNKKPNRVVMEKPLGSDLASSQDINNEVAKYFKENQIYRIDHYLGKETVLNLLALRFANSLFINNWDYRTIDHVQITVAEEVGIEGRWDYFDQAGQMRDMVQNHLLQILTMIAMSPPADLTADRIRDEKVKVLRSLRRIDYRNVREKTVRGQYTSGSIRGKKVDGYLAEEGANQSSKAETFVAIRVDIDDWRWAGVPFYLRTGKRLAAKCSEVVVYFKKPALNIFSDSYQDLPQNKLTIRLQPDEGIDIEILNKAPGLEHKHHLQTTKLDLSFSETFNQIHLADAYERLLLEAMRGIQALFVRRDEVEEAWKWVDSIMGAWAKDDQPPKLYQAGTWGPEASDAMIAKDGRSWNEFE
ncbi:Glucose-6-phosphate 1-dehydrogenase [Arsenophonus endosymbiont of Aleurodicus floccissimus]|uniref:glucose-6-phosphate dehydrogenase n=1 Tax=Arsenophonus endosymbiont of Aleurodicus floccissimus TaxID=2152761 RepID=UPI000E6AEB32|nr:glucose-6-phosphate dehydrogenase [Arsenophonus endosymbiont of Aleurodicus floccissimus]SPP31168.1 Glucose-6-phosphate 1-dehydrogenase [Arsenophonus endosymbiont of Aleurodicus floccissimus]